jgi:hypothetical protein
MKELLQRLSGTDTKYYYQEIPDEDLEEIFKK